MSEPGRPGVVPEPWSLDKMSTPKRKLVVFSLCLLPALTGAVLGQAGSTDEPVYNGKPLSVWVDEVSLHFSRTHTSRPDVQAVRAVGTNAIPWLLRELT